MNVLLILVLLTISVFAHGGGVVDSWTEVPNSFGLTIKVQATITDFILSVAGPSSGNWFGVAISNNDKMDSGDLALIYQPSDSENFAQTLGTQSSGSRADEAQLTWVKTTVDNVHTYTVTMPIDGLSIYTFPRDDAALFLLVAQGSGSSYSYHGTGGREVVLGFTLNEIAAGTAVAKIADEEPSSAMIAHAVFMGLAWVLLVPMAVIAAANKKNVNCVDNWFNIHKICNSLAILFTFIGFILAYSFTTNHFHEDHQTYGLVIFILASCQPFIAYMRPGHGEQYRWVFNVVHIIIGGFCLVFGIITCESGIGQIMEYGAENLEGLQDYMFAHVIIVVVIILASHASAHFRCSSDADTNDTVQGSEVQKTHDGENNVEIK